MPDLTEYAQTVTQGKIAGLPIWGIAIAGAGGLFILTRLRGGSSGTSTIQTLPGSSGSDGAGATPYDDSGLRSDIAGYSDATGQRFDTLSSDVNARFGDVSQSFKDAQTRDEALYRDFTGGFATSQSELKKTQDLLNANSVRSASDFESLRKLQAAGATQAQITALDKKIDTVNASVTTLRQQETERDKRMQTTVQKIDSILNAVRGMTVTKLPVTR